MDPNKLGKGIKERTGGHDVSYSSIEFIIQKLLTFSRRTMEAHFDICHKIKFTRL